MNNMRIHVILEAITSPVRRLGSGSSILDGQLHVVVVCGPDPGGLLVARRAGLGGHPVGYMSLRNPLALANDGVCGNNAV